MRSITRNRSAVSSSCLLNSSNHHIAAATTTITTIIPAVQRTCLRTIRNHHNYRHERSYSLLGKRHRFSRDWELKYGTLESYKKTGHELEAFENFATYAYDSREESTLDIATKDLRSLQPRDRYHAITGLLERRSKVRAGDGVKDVMPQVRLTVLAAECFEDMCRLEDGGNRSILDYNDADQYEFRSCVHSVINLVNKAKRDHPDCVAAAMRCVQIVNNVRESESERRFVMERTRAIVDELEDGTGAVYYDGGNNNNRQNAYATLSSSPLKRSSSSSSSSDNNNVMSSSLVPPSSHLPLSQKKRAGDDDHDDDDGRTVAPGSDYIFGTDEPYESPQARRRRQLMEANNEWKDDEPPLRLVSRKMSADDKRLLFNKTERRLRQEAKWFKAEPPVHNAAPSVDEMGFHTRQVAPED